MILLKRIPRELTEKRNLWDSKRRPWLAKAHRAFERYTQDVEETGTDYTKEQLKKIKEHSGIPVSTNLVFPLLNQYLALLMSNKPSFRVVSLDERGRAYANILDKAIKSIMYNSEAQGEEEETIKNMLITGMGISFVKESDIRKFGSFNIEYENLDPDIVILDSNARKRSLKDMEGFFIEKEITEYEANAKYNALLNKINQKRIESGKEPIDWEFFAYTGSDVPKKGQVDSDWYGNKIVVREYYDKVYTKMYLIEDGQNVRRVFAENLEEGADFVLANVSDVEENIFVRKTLMFGEYVVAIEILPIRDFPIKVKFYDWAGRPYKSFGVVHHIIQMQETMDKAIQLMLVNGMLINNAGYLAPKGGIPPEDKNKWETLGNKPGVVKEFVPTVIDGQAFVPQREQIQQLSNFYPMLITMMNQAMKESTGIFPSITGDSQEADIDTFSALKQYQDAAMQRIRLAMSHINLANQQLGNIVIDFLLANLDSEEFYLFFDENQKELTLLQEWIKDIQMSRYMALSVASELMPTQRLAMANNLMQIAQTTPDPYERDIYIQKAFELSDMRAFNDIREQIDVVRKLRAQLEQMQEQVKRDKELMKQYENRALNAEFKARLAEKIAKAEADIMVEEAKQKAQIKIDKLEEEIKDKNKS